MTIDTKGFLLTNKKNPFLIYKIIKQALIEDMMQVSGVDRQVDLWWNNKSEFSCPQCDISDFAEMMNVTFKYKGEDRRLAIFLDCDSDYSDCRVGEKIILSLGCWGSSVHLMEVCLNALRDRLEFVDSSGKAFIDNNDCDDVDFREL